MPGLRRVIASVVMAISPFALIPVASAGTVRAHLLTCTDTFNNSDANGLWSDANNWSGVSVPSTNDVACMSGFAVTVSGSSFTVGAVHGGVVTLNSPLALSSAASTSQLDGLTVSSTLSASSSATLDVAGAVTLGSGSLGATLSAGLTINQTAIAPFLLTGSGQITDGAIVSTPGVVTFANVDVVPVGSPSITTTNVNNFAAGTYPTAAGTLFVTAAAVNFSGNIAMRSINVTISGATSSFKGTNTTVLAEGVSVLGHAALSVPSGDVLIVANGPSTFAGTLSGAGTLTSNGQTYFGGFFAGMDIATVNVTGGVTNWFIGASSTNVNLSGGTIATSGGDVNVFTVTGGTLIPSGPSVDFSATTLNWSGGSISAAASSTYFDVYGTVCTISGTAVLDIVGVGMICHTLNVDASNLTTMTLGTLATNFTVFGALNFGANDVVKSASVNNAAFTTKNVNFTGSLNSAYGTGSDALTIFAGSATVPVGTTFDTGPLRLLGSVITVNGTLNAPAGLSLALYDNTTPIPSISGTGTVKGDILGEATYDPFHSVTYHVGSIFPGNTLKEGTLSVVGNIDVQQIAVGAGSPGNYGVLSASGTVTIETQPIMYFQGGYIPAVGSKFTYIHSTGLTVPRGSTNVSGSSSLLAYYSVAANAGVITIYSQPGHVANFHASVKVGAATISWTPPTQNGGAAITSYTVNGALYNNPFTPTAPCTYVVGVDSGNTCTISGLTIGQKYIFELSVSNGFTTNPSAALSNVVTVPANQLTLATPSPEWILTNASLFATTCTIAIGTLDSCSISVTSASAVLLASGTNTALSAAATLPVSLSRTVAASTLAGSLGGVLGTITATGQVTGGGSFQASQSLLLHDPTETGTIEDGALFIGSTANFSAAGKKYMSTLTGKLIGAKSASCVGYTDNTGTVSKQHAIGLARATAVCKVLKLAIATAVATSNGSKNPIATNGTTKGRAMNNRVVLSVSY